MATSQLATAALTDLVHVPEPDKMLPLDHESDAQVDVEVLRSVPKQFAIVDETSANWLLRRICAARQYSEHVKIWAEAERRRAEREEACLMYLFGRQLQDWAKTELAKTKGKKKSVALPAATVGWRTAPASLQVDDEDTVLSWARENCPAAVVVTERLSKTELKKFYEATGAVPDEGAHIEPAAERFYVR